MPPTRLCSHTTCPLPLCVVIAPFFLAIISFFSRAESQEPGGFQGANSSELYTLGISRVPPLEKSETSKPLASFLSECLRLDGLDRDVGQCSSKVKNTVFVLVAVSEGLQCGPLR